MITRVFDRFGLLRVVLLKTSNHVVNAPLSTAETTPSSDFARLLRQTSQQLYSNIFCVHPSNVPRCPIFKNKICCSFSTQKWDLHSYAFLCALRLPTLADNCASSSDDTTCF